MHQTQPTVIEGRVSPEDFQGNQDANAIANLGAAENDDPHEPSADWLDWEVINRHVSFGCLWLRSCVS
eukprot:3399709-Amphidinium_carterae.1